MRRTAMSHRFAPFAIVLIVVALLAGSAGGASPFARHARAGLATATSAGRRVETVRKAPGGPTETTDVVRPRASATAVTRAHVPGAGGTDGARGTVAPHASASWLGALMPRAPGAVVEARAHGITSPGQPAPASRAPPLG